PEQIMVVSGSQQALDLATRVLLDAGSSAWVEEPGYWLVHRVLQARECRAVPVPVDGEGLDVSAGVKLGRKARAAFVAPSHQYPLGVTMSASRRLQLLEWARSAGAWIIEDEYDSEDRYDTMAIASLQGLDTDGRVISRQLQQSDVSIFATRISCHPSRSGRALRRNAGGDGYL